MDIAQVIKIIEWLFTLVFLWPKDAQYVLDFFGILGIVLAIICVWRSLSFKFIYLFSGVIVAWLALFYVHEEYVHVGTLNDKIDTIIVYPIFMNDRLRSVYTLDKRGEVLLNDSDIREAIRTQSGVFCGTSVTYVCVSALMFLAYYFLTMVLIRVAFVLLPFIRLWGGKNSEQK